MLDFETLDDFDFYLAALVVVAAVCTPRRFLPETGARPERPSVTWFFRKAYRPLLVVFAASFLINVLIARSCGIPAPQIHDEFAYLLASDTFASGRLTNETHPMWKHLESFQVFHTPSYQAKYPPGQGVLLALGQVLTGEPIFGVWLSLALACAAVCWMLLAIFPAGWAMVGGLLAAVCPSMVLSWGQSYWGGAVAMLGGGLTFGALFRFRRRVKVVDAVVLGGGLVILANSRPYEGFVVSVPSAAYALCLTAGWITRNGWRPVTTRFLVPLVSILVVAGAGMLCYNYELVGDAWKLPWVHYQSQGFEASLGFTGSPPLSLPFKFARFWLFYLGPVLTIALIPLTSIVLRRESCFALVLTLLLFCVSAFTSRAWPHYTAPVACLVYVVVIEGLRGLRKLRPGGRPVGALLGRAAPIAYFVSSLIMIGAVTQQGPNHLWADDRRALLEMLEEGPDRHLVLVRYSKRHSLHEEWVYNRADIDGSDVVWARERSGPENQELLTYFKDRRVWVLLADGPPRLIPVHVGLNPRAAGGGEQHDDR